MSKPHQKLLNIIQEYFGMMVGVSLRMRRTLEWRSLRMMHTCLGQKERNCSNSMWQLFNELCIHLKMIERTSKMSSTFFLVTAENIWQ